MGRHRLKYHWVFNNEANWETPYLKRQTVHLGPKERAWLDWERRYRTAYSMMVGDRIKRARLSRGLTQNQLTQRVHRPVRGRYSQGFISRLEKGYAGSPLYAYIHMAQALDLEPGRLLGSDEAQKPISESEMTLVRFLRRAGIPPDEAIASLAGLTRRGR